MPILLVDPTSSSYTDCLSLAKRFIVQSHSVLALVNNGKPNVDRILKGLLTDLRTTFGWATESESFIKPHASRILATDQVNQIVRRCHFAIVGVGD